MGAINCVNCDGYFAVGKIADGHLAESKVAVIVGPTAVGKTALAIELAEKIGGEIISCDSMQVYRGMDIGTAKPTEEEKRGIPHHMIDVAEPEDDYSCAEYAAAAREWVRDIAGRGKLPIFCGGTGLYLEAALNPGRHEPPGQSAEIREELSKLDSDELHRRLGEADPLSAAAVHPNNRGRVIRALEIYMLTGTPKSEWDRRSRERASAPDVVTVGLDFADREALYRRIDLRVDQMLTQGLADEVASLAGRLGRTASQAIGYKEMLAHLRGEATLDEAAAEIKRATRAYAKRQLTWFRKTEAIMWHYVDKTGNIKNIVNNLCTLLTN